MSSGRSRSTTSRAAVAPPFPNIRPASTKSRPSVSPEISIHGQIEETTKKNTLNLRCFHPGNQHGKRKFLPEPFEGNNTNKVCRRRKDSGCCDEIIGDDDEAGLSLLFAASLIQQNESSNNNHHNDDPMALVSTNAAVLDAVLPSQVPRSFHNKDRKSDPNTIHPTENDVLCGRGGGINRHFGNVIYRRVVEYNKTVYKGVPKRYRQLVSQSIVQAILNAGGRFLQQNNKDDSWKEIHFRRAVQKTSQALRERIDEDTHMTQAPLSTVTALLESPPPPPPIFQAEPYQDANKSLDIEKVEENKILDQERPILPSEKNSPSRETIVVVPL